MKNNTSNDFAEIFKSESIRGDRINWNLQWILYSIILLLSFSVYFIQGIEVGKYGIYLSLVNLAFNAGISYIIIQKKSVIWVRYITVALNIITLTIYIYMDATYNSALVPVTTACLLLYPVVIFFAALRMDKRLIIWATLLSIISMDGLYLWFYNSFDSNIAKQLVSADIFGQLYRTVYVAFCGGLMFTVPIAMRRMLLAQERLAKESLKHQHKSLHDPLTGIPNRLKLDEYLNTIYINTKSTDRNIALYFIDIDGFKAVNDTYGHALGDYILKSVALDLTATAHENDMVARIGGDEFVVVSGEVRGHNEALSFGNRLLTNIVRPRTFGDVTLTVGSSIGISLYPDDALDINQLIKHGDEAMYSVKKTGKNNIGIYKEQSVIKDS